MPSALVVFTSRPNSHPFQERHVYLDEPVKIGRSVARCRSAQNNAIFDCKVLSRNHALLWFDRITGKFYLQDTGSSNGTFINSQRLSQAGEDSPPSQVLSGDIIQFGVDVTESSRSVTHGCVVSSVRLFLPDGVEACKRSDVTPASSPPSVKKVLSDAPSVYSQELFQLSQYLQEALQREQMLEQKLVTLKRMLASTQVASENSWQALVDEDQLLSRLEVMGNMLQVYSTNQSEENLRELVALQDQHSYETKAKDTLRRVLGEKVEVSRTLAKVERNLSNAQSSCCHLQRLKERAEEELTELANKYNTAVNLIKDLTNTLKACYWHGGACFHSRVEQQQEEETQRLLREKEELQLHVSSMGEREQALQASSELTNQRLSSLQGLLEQLQEKIVKSNILENLLLKNGGDGRFIHQLLECKRRKEILDDRLLKIQNAEDIRSDQTEKLKGRLLNGHLQNIMDEKALLKEVQMDVAEWAVSDALSSCKDHTTEHSTVSQMDELEQSKSMNKDTPLVEETGPGEQRSIEAEQALERLSAQLHDAQDQVNSSQRKCAELQDVLEKERRETQLLSQDSANQIQALQAQVQKLKGEVKALRAERESVATSAQEEVLLVRRAMEASAGEQERERASMKEGLASVTAEMERWRQRGRLRAGDQEPEGPSAGPDPALCAGRAAARRAPEELLGPADGVRSPALRQGRAPGESAAPGERAAQLSGSGRLLAHSVTALEQTQGELERRLAEQRDQHQKDTARLKAQQDQAANRIKGLQREYEDTQGQLDEVKQRCCEVEQEKISLAEELKQCRQSLLQQKERTSQLENTKAQLIQVKQKCSEVEQEKLSLSEELQKCKENLKQLQEKISQYEETEVQLIQVKQKCCEAEQEKLSLSEELEQCRASLRQLQERSSRPSLQPILAVLTQRGWLSWASAVVVMVAGGLLYTTLPETI
ncbi:hypothetical protein AGOR_G00132620 [Albula goreensis]|uniref:Sarcolemmal membrane-associated protein n=1 Tax=Albula goreensis TaxID=1534307 RepID=A0A8T3D7V9_9TELE|nr:hypothetical protein AGOR_G00132620 [Albula goreensis]